MHGNVYEWCQDWYEPYPGGIAIDPRGPATGSARVARGGFCCGWPGSGYICRSAVRIAYGPDSRVDGIGFRVVLAQASRELERWRSAVSVQVLARLSRRAVGDDPPTRQSLLQDFCRATHWRNRKCRGVSPDP